MERTFQDTFKEQLSSTNEKTILNVLSQASGSLFYEITEATDIDLEICIESSANLKLFVLNRSNGDVNLNLTIHVDQDATCQMGLLDLQDGKFNWKQYVDLKKAGAEFSILSGQLCMPDTTKICSMEVCHEDGNTFGQMQNFAVLLIVLNMKWLPTVISKRMCPGTVSSDNKSFNIRKRPYCKSDSFVVD